MLQATNTATREWVGEEEELMLLLRCRLPGWCFSHGACNSADEVPCLITVVSENNILSMVWEAGHKMTSDGDAITRGRLLQTFYSSGHVTSTVQRVRV